LHHLCSFLQGGWRSRRQRRCLLKGCERLFFPTHPLARYCSAACRLAARRWNRWRASQRYRATESGQERRREQNRRYRQRRRERQAQTERAAPADVPEAGEGQLKPAVRENFHERPCHRPGCYVLFVVKDERSCQRFCSLACCLALRRVLQREERYQQRRRHGRRQRRTRVGQRPNTS